MRPPTVCEPRLFLIFYNTPTITDISGQTVNAEIWNRLPNVVSLHCKRKSRPLKVGFFVSIGPKLTLGKKKIALFKFKIPYLKVFRAMVSEYFAAFALLFPLH